MYKIIVYIVIILILTNIIFFLKNRINFHTIPKNSKFYHVGDINEILYNNRYTFLTDSKIRTDMYHIVKTKYNCFELISKKPLLVMTVKHENILMNLYYILKISNNNIDGFMSIIDQFRDRENVYLLKINRDNFYQFKKNGKVK